MMQCSITSYRKPRVRSVDIVDAAVAVDSDHDHSPFSGLRPMFSPNSVHRLHIVIENARFATFRKPFR